MKVLLFALPRAVTCDIISQWIDHKDVAQIDSACCSRIVRPQYLKTISSSDLVLDEIKTDILTFANLAAWLNLRSVSVHGLTIPTLFWKYEMDGFLSAKNVSRLKRLNLEMCADITDEIFCGVLRGCRQLSEVSVGSSSHSCWITDVSLRHLSTATNQLKVLKISQCSLISDDGIESICVQNSSLRVIEILSCRVVGDRTAAAIAKHCPKLVRLKLIDLSPLSGTSMTSLCVSSLALEELELSCVGNALPVLHDAAANVLSQLQSLVLAGFHATAHLRDLLYHARHLQHLTLRNIHGLLDEALTSLTTDLHSLETLQIDACHSLTPVGTSALIRRCPVLREAHFHAVTLAPSVGEALAHCDRVVEWRATWCRGDLNGALAALIQHAPAPAPVPVSGLDHDLDLDDLLSQPQPAPPTASASAASLPLRAVVLTGCATLTNAGLQIFVAGLPALLSLDVSYCRLLTAESLRTLAEACPKLKIKRDFAHLNLLRF